MFIVPEIILLKPHLSKIPKSSLGSLRERGKVKRTVKIMYLLTGFRLMFYGILIIAVRIQGTFRYYGNIQNRISIYMYITFVYRAFHDILSRPA